MALRDGEISSDCRTVRSVPALVSRNRAPVTIRAAVAPLSFVRRARNSQTRLESVRAGRLKSRARRHRPKKTLNESARFNGDLNTVLGVVSPKGSRASLLL